MPVTLALAGDTMLGRGVAERIIQDGPLCLFAPEIRDITTSADLFVLNLECCVSERGEPWPDPFKPFFFRAPPAAVETLVWLGVDAVTLANNHALDFGRDALLDTRAHLDRAGITAVGAGADQAQARAPAVVEAAGVRVGILGVTDHPADYAAGAHTPGVAYADLYAATPDWLVHSVAALRAQQAITLVLPHWGPNMTRNPPAHVRAAATALTEAGASLVAGHSAHVFHGARRGVCYDLGDFVDDYAVHRLLRNDLGLLFLVTLTEAGPTALAAVPLALDYCHTRLARDEEFTWVRDRFTRACAAFGTDVHVEDDRLVARWA